MSKENLKSVRKGQKGIGHPASKPEDEHRSKSAVANLTVKEHSTLKKDAKSVKLSVSNFLRQKLGFNP